MASKTLKKLKLHPYTVYSLLSRKKKTWKTNQTRCKFKARSTVASQAKKKQQKKKTHTHTNKQKKKKATDMIQESYKLTAMVHEGIFWSVHVHRQKTTSTSKNLQVMTSKRFQRYYPWSKNIFEAKRSWQKKKNK